MHHRSLVERKSCSEALLRSCLLLYQRAGGLHCPEHASVFTTKDNFDRDYVTPVRTTVDGVTTVSPSPAERNTVHHSSHASLSARLLLEWGHAQHFFGKVCVCLCVCFVAF